MENRSFSMRLTILRHSLFMNQKEFAHLTGLTTSSLSAYESGLKNPGIDKLIMIAKNCNVSLDWLCGLKDEEEQFKIYGDLFKIFISLKELYMYFYEFYQLEKEYTLIFRDPIMRSFMKELHDILQVKANSVLGDDIYKIWVEKKLGSPEALTEIDPFSGIGAFENGEPHGDLGKNR